MEHKEAHRSGSARIRKGSIALALMAASCGYCGRPPADATFTHHTLMEWIQESEVVPPSFYSSPARAADGAPVLYLDASASMRGFADAAGAFEYSRALRALEGVADQLDAAQPLTVRRVDTAIQELPAAQALLAASSSAAFYDRAAGSDVAATIHSFAAAAAPNGGRHVDLFITDGMHGLPHSAIDAHCTGVAGARCVQSAIRGLIERGWGAHVFAIRSRFAGPVYPVVRGGGAVGFYRAVDPAAPDRLRPFLLFVFTEDRGQLEGLVNKVREAMEATGIDPLLIHELPLTLPLIKDVKLELDTAGYSIHAAGGGAAPKANPLSLARGGARQLDFNGQPLRDDVQILHYGRQDVDLPLPGAVRLTASVELTPAGTAMFGSTGGNATRILQRLSIHEIARPPSWYAPPQTLAWPPPGFQLKSLQFDGTVADTVSEPLVYAAVAATPRRADPDPPAATATAATAAGHLSFRWSRVGNYLPLTLLRVEARLDPASLHLPAWVSTWSTDDDADLVNANRLLHLRQLAEELERTPYSASQVLKPWYLVIWPDNKS
jgi:hypothetical protein